MRSFKGKMLKKISLVWIAAVLFISAVFAEPYQVELQPQVLEKVASIEQRGILRQKGNGYVYVEVSNGFISETLPLITAPLIPSFDYTRENGIGAHISVMNESELISNDIWEIHEVGEEFTFTVIELCTVECSYYNRIRKLWMLRVEAPELEHLRRKYGLSSKLHGHEFHITLGIQTAA
jgi:hypothetical protein